MKVEPSGSHHLSRAPLDMSQTSAQETCVGWGDSSSALWSWGVSKVSQWMGEPEPSREVLQVRTMASLKYSNPQGSSPVFVV